MKRAVNFRLSNKALTALSLLESEMHIPKTEVVERAIQYYMKNELSNQGLILKYAGILSDQEAESMLAAIESSKHNKDIDIEL